MSGVPAEGGGGEEQQEQQQVATIPIATLPDAGGGGVEVPKTRKRKGRASTSSAADGANGGMMDNVVEMELPDDDDEQAVSRPDGAAIAAAAGLPQFLWETQQSKRKRDPNAPKLRRQRYSKEHKQMVLNTLHNSAGVKLPEIARQFNLPEGTLRGWFDDERRQKAAEGPEQVEQDGGGPADNENNQNKRSSTATESDANDNNATAGAGADTEVPARPKKKRRQRYSNETKIQVILALETRPHVSLNEVAKEFNVAAGTVRGWREEADKIQKQAMQNRRVGAKANPSRDPLRRIWDAILDLFEKNSRLPVTQRLDVNVAVVRTIGKQARDIILQSHEEYLQVQEQQKKKKQAALPAAADSTKVDGAVEGTSGEDTNAASAADLEDDIPPPPPPRIILTETEYTNMQKFKASETWARKWARDHQVISSRPETMSQVEFASKRLMELQELVTSYRPEHVYSMTSTSLFYKILPHRTYVSRLAASQKRVRACKGLKCKDRLTLYLCANESGTDKLPIACIGKYEHPACFRVPAQRILPYFHQSQSLSDAGTFQMWWRTAFLPHVRSRYQETGEKVLLLVESLGPCKAELLKDPTDQVRVEALPPSFSSTMLYSSSAAASSSSAGGGGAGGGRASSGRKSTGGGRKSTGGRKSSAGGPGSAAAAVAAAATAAALSAGAWNNAGGDGNVVDVSGTDPNAGGGGTMSNATTAAAEAATADLHQCQALEYGIVEMVKRRYRYRLLREVMDAFDERAERRLVASRTNFPTPASGLREGSLANLADSMRLLQSVWSEVASTTIAKAWQRTRLRPRSGTKNSKDISNGGDVAGNVVDDTGTGGTTGTTTTTNTRSKSEKRQNTREKKLLIKDLNNFLTKHESKDFTKEDGSNQLEEMIEKLKNCFLYTDGEVIETKEILESLEEWIGLEDSQGMVALFMEELKQEMNIEYLVGLEEPIEGVVPEAEEDDEIELEPEQVERNRFTNHVELDMETAIGLATTIKGTACKLFHHGNILGELALRLDEASESVFRLLRKQRETAHAKREAEKIKLVNKQSKEAMAAAKAAAEAAAAPEEEAAATEKESGTAADGAATAVGGDDITVPVDATTPAGGATTTTTTTTTDDSVDVADDTEPVATTTAAAPDDTEPVATTKDIDETNNGGGGGDVTMTSDTQTTPTIEVAETTVNEEDKVIPL